MKVVIGNVQANMMIKSC